MSWPQVRVFVGGDLVTVTDWLLAELAEVGWLPADSTAVAVPGLRHGNNSAVRVDHSTLIRAGG